MIQTENEKNWESFLKLCSTMKSPEEFQKLFSLFLTFEERETLASRLVIIKALLEGWCTQRKLSETYKVSIAQITRGSNALKIVDSEFKKFLLKRIEEL